MDPEANLSKGSALTLAAIGTVMTAGSIALCYFFADRQLAEALKPVTAGLKPLFVALTHIVNPFAPAASLILAAVAIRAALRQSFTPLELALARGACAILIAGVFTFELKEAFGRTWPETWTNNNPSYFGNQVYGFFPFHGGSGYASFPSGHTTAAAAFAAAIWFLWPRIRWLGIAVVAAVAIGLLGADFHWFSDLLAGGAVGGVTGWAAARLPLRSGQS